MELQKEIVDALRDPKKVKTLTTVDKDGMPHTVPIGSMTLLEDGNIAFMELLETCQTQRNMLNCCWFKKDVSILVIVDWAKGKVYQIKGRPYKFLYIGPIWNQFLEKVWKVIPEADPSGVWLITPHEVRSQKYSERRKVEEERRANWTTWMTLKGARK